MHRQRKPASKTPSNPIAQTGIPYDIFHRIFALCIHECDRNERDRLPLAISQVSRIWRAAALQTPFLWERLLLGTSRAPDIHMLYDYRLQLCGDRMITLDIHANRDLYAGELEVVTKYAGRTEKLIVNPFSYRFLPLALFGKLQKVMFPVLKEFEYSVDSVKGSLVRVVRDAKDLFRLPEVDRHQKIQWGMWGFGTITELVLGFLHCGAQAYYMDLWNILNRCRTTLQVLEYYGGNPPYKAGDETQESLEFPSLRTVVWGYTEDISPIVRFVRAPRLQELTIRNIVECPPSPQLEYYPKVRVGETLGTTNLLAAYLEEELPLRALHLFGCRADYMTLTVLLRNARQLQTLTFYQIRCPDRHPNYFDALVEWYNHERLQKLVISPADGALAGYLSRRRIPLQECIVDEAAYETLEWQDLVRPTDGTDQDTANPVLGVQNLGVMKDPIEHECHSLAPFMLSIVDGKVTECVEVVEDEDELELASSISDITLLEL